MHITEGACAVQELKERQKVPAHFNVSSPLPYQSLPIQLQWEAHRANNGVTLSTMSRDSSNPDHGLLALLNHAPLAHTTISFPLLCLMIHFHIKEASFDPESCTLTKMTENVWIQHLRNVTFVVQWVTARRPQRSNVTKEFFNINLDRNVQSTLGPAQGKMVK